MNRRAVLALAASGMTAAIAGCSAPSVSYQMEELEWNNLYDALTTETDPDDDAFDLINQSNGGTTPVTIDGEVAPVNEGIYHHEDNAYYVTYEKGDITSEQVEVLLITEQADQSNDLQYSDLPKQDADSVAELVTSDRDRMSFLYSEEEVNSSEIIDESLDYGEYRDIDDLAGADIAAVTVSYDGDSWHVVGVKGPTIPTHEYEYTVSLVAENESAFTDWVEEELLIDLDGVSGDQREIVEDAIDGGYQSHSVETPYVELTDLFYGNRSIGEVDQTGGEWVVEYDGVLYRAELHHPATVRD